MAYRRQTRRGFLISEIPFVILIIAIALVALSVAMTQGVRGMEEGRWTLAARAAATQQLEAIQSRGYADIIATPPNPTFTVPGFPQANGQVTVTNPYQGQAGLLQVTVTVTLGSRVWRLSTLLAQ